MITGQDDVDRFLVAIRKRRNEIRDRLANGEAKPDNVIGGYYHQAGEIKGLRDAEEIFRRFFVDFAEPVEKAIVTEY